MPNNSMEPTRPAAADPFRCSIQALAGLAALQNSYSLEELVVKDENGDWRLNEEMTGVLRHIAANDPDAELRTKANESLNADLRPWGEKIERRKAAENR